MLKGEDGKYGEKIEKLVQKGSKGKISGKNFLAG